MQDLKGSVARIAQFLEKSLDSEVIAKIADQCLFKNMKQNKMCNYSLIPGEVFDQRKLEFLRKGELHVSHLFFLHILYYDLEKSFNVPAQYSNKAMKLTRNGHLYHATVHSV